MIVFGGLTVSGATDEVYLFDVGNKKFNLDIRILIFWKNEFLL